MTDRPHGYARYKLDRCRCYTCAWAVAQYNDARQQAIHRGTWQPFTDAAPARDHALRLKACGFGDRQIAELAGLNRTQVRSLLHGRPERGTPPPAQIRPRTALALLQVEPTFDNLPPATLVQAVGTLRRARALVAAGWPQARLAARLGVAPGNFSALLVRSRVTVATARGMQALYDQLWNSDPAAAGVSSQAVARARNHASAHG